MKVSKIILLLVAVVAVISAIAHILGAQQQQQFKMTKKLLKLGQNKKLLRTLMDGRRDALMCTRAMAGDKPVVVFQIEHLHVLADHMPQYLKPIAAFEDRNDIYEFCVQNGQPLRELDQIVFVPRQEERLENKGSKKKDKSGWFSRVKRFIGLETTAEETSSIPVQQPLEPEPVQEIAKPPVKKPVREMFRDLAMPF